MPVFLNIFEASFSDPNWKLPVCCFDNHDQLKEFVAEKQIPKSEYYFIRNKNSIKLMLLRSCSENSDLEEEEFSPLSNRWLAQRAIRKGLASHYLKQNLDVTENKFSVSITREVEQNDSLGVVIRAGVRSEPFVSSGIDFIGISLNWSISVEFIGTAEETAKTFRITDLPVKLIEDREHLFDDTEAITIGRFIGTISEVKDGIAKVFCRDRETRTLPLNQLVLEAKPEVFSSLESQIVQRAPISMQQRLLQLSHSLTTQNRKNKFVLRDQMKEITSFLGAHNQFVNIKLPLPFKGIMKISTAPRVSRKAENV